MKLSLVVPAYNEESRLAPMVDVYLDYFQKKYGSDFEMIIVVNGSVDDTPSIARDFETNWGQVSVIVEHIGDAGLIMASRWMPGAVVEPRQPLARRIASRIFNRLVRWFFRVNITDTQCGAKLMTRKALNDVLPLLGLTRWAFDVDLLFQTRRKGYKIVERATVWRDVEGSQLNIPRASTEMFIAICRLRMLHSPFQFVVSVYDVTLGKLLHRK